MNCKPGDRAVVIAAIVHPELIGSVVEIIEHVPCGDMAETCFGLTLSREGEHNWLVHGRRGYWVHSDRRLWPLRDNDGEDETLTWAPVPHKETA